MAWRMRGARGAGRARDCAVAVVVAYDLKGLLLAVAFAMALLWLIYRAWS